MAANLDDLLFRLGTTVPDFVVWVDSVKASLIGQGALIKVTMKAGATQATIAHGLGRYHQGGLIASVTSALSVQALPAKSDKAITLVTGTAPTVDVGIMVWVF